MDLFDFTRRINRQDAVQKSCRLQQKVHTGYTFALKPQGSRGNPALKLNLRDAGGFQILRFRREAFRCVYVSWFWGSEQDFLSIGFMLLSWQRERKKIGEDGEK
ncbi:hypothetical protein CAPTEDRAFT_188287 [Capitella teleta]|uniref:Uncharacterized protein n=1 Tax=Capitella teleta TaxID=283909 RepID=R7TLA7_CAPTE|nr:hypothetical protein CAPTEDRAFT_188287 [Capitella teleta]|eukprot:ELT91885.1 hypothetical protein CAPTEDRAFT_188287 [Capitella teleta]